MFFTKNQTVLLPTKGQENWHENFIVHLASVIRPKTYVELGLYKCELFNRIIPFAENLIGVDNSSNAGEHMKKSPKTKFVFSDTATYHKQIEKNPIIIDMLFIDANHSKESVREDFHNFFPFIADQGIILLHDGYPKNESFVDPGYCGDGYKAIEELSKINDQYEMVTIPIHPGLTICRKRLKHLAWE